jgi:hypothetical protein
MASTSIDAAVFWGTSLNLRVEPCMVMKASKWHVDVSVVVMTPSSPYTALVTVAYIAFSRVT